MLVEVFTATGTGSGWGVPRCVAGDCNRAILWGVAGEMRPAVGEVEAAAVEAETAAATRLDTTG